MDAYKIGMASLELGAGRKTKEDEIEPVAGIKLHHKVGDRVEAGETFVTGYTNDKTLAESSKEYLEDAFTIGSEKPKSEAMVTHRIDKNGIHSLTD
jgi:pyrimidine-nucleoside phosphorylase